MVLRTARALAWVLFLSAYDISTYAGHTRLDIPLVDFDTLLSPEGAVHVLHTMSTIGVVGLTNVPGYDIRAEALRRISSACLDADDGVDTAKELALVDGELQRPGGLGWPCTWQVSQRGGVGGRGGELPLSGVRAR